MVEEKPGFHQRRYLVDKRFQIKYTLLVTSVSAVIFCILGYFLYQKSVANTQILQIQNLDVQSMVARQDHEILYLLMGFFVLQMGSLCLLGILITHRIAGPVFRVQKYLEDLAETGEFMPLNPVRERDEFSGFFVVLGKLIDRLKNQREQQRAKIEELRLCLERGDTNRAKVLGQELLLLL